MQGKDTSLCCIAVFSPLSKSLCVLKDVTGTDKANAASFGVEHFRPAFACVRLCLIVFKRQFLVADCPIGTSILPIGTRMKRSVLPVGYLQGLMRRVGKDEDGDFGVRPIR